MYGGTERIVSYLTEELVRRGHDVTLFASGDSKTRARLVAGSPQALRLSGGTPEIFHVLMLEELFKDPYRFDLIHFHTDYLHFSLSRRYNVPHVTTLHGRLDLPDLVPLYREFREMPVTSISDAQRRPLPWINWLATVHHGLPEHQFRFVEEAEDYLAFVGRISPEKRPDRAIEIAKRTGLKLKIAAKVDKVDAAYFERCIEPLLDHPLVEFVGEIGDDAKNEFVGRARALLFPIDWPEPFGLVMIEAFACGTPVIAFRCGSVPEVMRHGVSGWVVTSVDEAVAAVDRIDRFDRRGCRAYFESRFTASRMAADYVRLYDRISVDRGDVVFLAPGTRDGRGTVGDGGTRFELRQRGGRRFDNR